MTPLPLVRKLRHMSMSDRSTPPNSLSQLTKILTDLTTSVEIIEAQNQELLRNANHDTQEWLESNDIKIGSIFVSGQFAFLLHSVDCVSTELSTVTLVSILFPSLGVCVLRTWELKHLSLNEFKVFHIQTHTPEEIWRAFPMTVVSDTDW